MGFANSYLTRHQLFPVHISEPPSGLLNFIVIIPVYLEDNLIETLVSLYNCERPKSHVEIFLVFNSSESDPEKIKYRNQKTLDQTKAWLEEKNTNEFRFFILHFPDLPKKFAGAGLARKIGMDAAVSRFNQIDHKKGFILSFDADSNCEPDYFTTIESAISELPEINGFTLYFEHPLTGSEFKPEVYKAVTQYELHMRYYIQGLRYAGFPYAFHTIGSCFGVTADIYCKQGGMNRRQGGEDFYFLHKVIPQGNFTEINKTTVYPSPRPSTRVPFGTGPVIQKLISGTTELETFHPTIFDELKGFIGMTDSFFRKTAEELIPMHRELPQSFQSFIDQEEFVKSLSEINENCASLTSFKKRFFQWFNAFRIFKFLNYCSDKLYPKVKVSEAARKLLDTLEIMHDKDISNEEILKIYRRYQRQNIYSIYPHQQ